jgi:two-component system sensor histidine kinase KdpD
VNRLTFRRPATASLARTLALTCAALGASTLAIAVLRATVHVTYPAPVYLLAVLAVGVRHGTVPAAITSVAAFLLYDFLFVQPLYTLSINSPDEWLNLLLLLAVSVAIGRMAAALSSRATEAADRAREAESLHAINGILAATRTVAEAAPAVVSQLRSVTSMDRVWFGLGGTAADERVLADTSPSEPLPLLGWQVVLQRTPDGETRWVRAHVPGVAKAARVALHRIRVEVAGETLGSLWAVRTRGRPEPDRAETRILSAAADQLGQVVMRDRLAREATTAEIARESEALKTALLDSVSHDLRTPLATIRAAAGSMLDPEVHWSPDEQREAFQAIDAEAERMGRLVRNLLDLSRIEGGALKPDMEARLLPELADQAIQRVDAAGKTISSDVPRDLSPVMVDEVYANQILVNLLENAVRYGGRAIRVSGRPGTDETLVDLIVEDDGEGVPSFALPRLFDKFYQAPRASRPAGRGMGIGLTVVAGLASAMGGTVRAERSPLGGLAVVVSLPAVKVPVEAAAPQ